MGTSALPPYTILRVSADATHEELSVAFRDSIHAFNAKRLPTRIFRRVCRAYECLTNDDQRRHFDETSEWISILPIKNYTLQQLSNESELWKSLDSRLNQITREEINAQDPNTSYTLLYCAARVGNKWAVQTAIDRNGPLDVLQSDGSTALHAAAFYGHTDTVRYLLENGANSSILNQTGNFAEQEAFDDSTRQVFAELQESVFVQVAANQFPRFKANPILSDWNVNDKYYCSQQTLLHCASKKGFLDIVRWLVKEHSADLNIVDCNGNSALHLAVINDHVVVVKYLSQSRRESISSQSSERHCGARCSTILSKSLIILPRGG